MITLTRGMGEAAGAPSHRSRESKQTAAVAHRRARVYADVPAQGTLVVDDDELGEVELREVPEDRSRIVDAMRVEAHAFCTDRHGEIEGSLGCEDPFELATCSLLAQR